MNNQLETWKFKYNKILHNTSQEDVFDYCARDIISNIVEGYNLRELGFLSHEYAHLWAEASKRAFCDRNTYLADPDFVSRPVEELVSDAYAAKRREEIDPDRATPSEEVKPGLPAGAHAGARHEGKETTHYSVLDGDGNAVAVTRGAALRGRCRASSRRQTSVRIVFPRRAAICVGAGREPISYGPQEREYHYRQR